MRITSTTSTMSLGTLFALLLGGTLLSGTAIARPFTARDLVGLDRLSDPQVSPDGSRVVFTVRSTDLDADKARRALWLLSLTDPRAAPVAVPDGADASDPHWTADGKAILAIRTAKDGAQVWRLSPDGGGAVQVTHLPLDVTSFRADPDGDHLVVSMDVFPDTESPDDTRARLDRTGAAKAEGRIYDRMFVRHWDSWADGTRSHLFAVSMTGHGPVVPLMPHVDGDTPNKPFGDEGDYAVSPDGRQVFFSVRTAGRTEPWSTNFDIWQVPLDGSAAPRNLTAANPAWDAHPTPSPDGRFLAYTATKRPGFEADRFGVMLMDLSTGRTREVDPHWDRSAQSLSWSADGRTLYVTAEDVGQGRLFALDVASGAVTPLTGAGHVSDAMVLPDGGFLVQRDALDSPAQLWRIPAKGGTGSELTRVGGAALNGVELVPGEQFSFTGWNHETVHGYVVNPDGFQAGHKYPVAFLIHGGPQGSFGNDWSYRWNPQFYAGLGYAAVMIDFHGSTGYGQAFTDSISGHWGDRPLEDLQKGWAAALAKYPFLDGSRACALGASYGGFMVNWIAGNWPAAFKCLVTHDGVFDDRMMGFSTDELWFSEWEHGGPGHTPWSDPAAYERFNPADHVAAWRDPQLIVQGALDYRIPMEQGLGAFDALQRRGIPSELLVFPHENHWVLKPADSLQWHATVAAWLHRWLETDGTDAGKGKSQP